MMVTGVVSERRNRGQVRNRDELTRNQGGSKTEEHHENPSVRSGEDQP
jgi:hypothetical protein